MKHVYRMSAFVAALLAAGIALGCSPKAPQEKGPVVVASKIDTEGSLLGSMIVTLLEDAGFKAVDRVQLGATGVVRKAILAGEIDIYPEYTGNAAFFHDEPDNPVWKDAQAAWARAKDLDAPSGLIWLRSAPANNTWAVAVRGDLASREGLKTMSDLGRYISRGGRIKLAGSEEFVSSAAALPAFQEAYGFRLRQDQLVVLAGGNTAATERAAAEGTDGVNAAMAYGTDGQLAAFGLVVLEDDKGVQPVYEPAPLIRASVLERYPDIARVLEPAFAKLDLVSLQTLNSMIAVEGRPAREVAREWLKAQGFLR